MVKKIQDHFSKISNKYRNLRMTDLKPILFITNKLKKFPKITAADIGSGAGRYDLQLFRYLGKKLYLYCVDANKKMLEQLSSYLSSHNIKRFQTIKSFARKLPDLIKPLDCIFTFNAIQHFKILGFLNETSQILKKNGYLFIYTRLRSQNKRSIWGKYFPFFNQKETRLYELNELKKIIKKVSQLKIESVKFFKYKRKSTLNCLIEQAKKKHYSTFFLYKHKEFKQSLERFEVNIKKHFKDLKNITWFDENILLILKKIDQKYQNDPRCFRSS